MGNSATVEKLVRAAAWTDRLPEEQKTLYRKVMREARLRGLRFAVGGGFASNVYTGGWRNTKDLDLFILRSDRDAMVRVLTGLGLRDYYDQKPYDRQWIYRGYDGEQIVDVIWQMANQRAVVDEIWVESGPIMEVDGEEFHVIPPEETLWTKLYVVQRERCDWPDAFNLICAIGPELDWPRLIDRVGPDTALLAGVLSIFGWLCPKRALELPPWLWKRVGARVPIDGGQCRAPLLDSRPWMVPPC